MTISQLRNSFNRSPLRRGFLLMPPSLMLTCFALMPMAQAVGPDTDGAIAGSNNGEGIGVLVSRAGGVWNTGTGFEALNHLTPATKIRRRVFEPCLAIPMAASIPLLAF
jgi:hypothetical protein